MSNEPNETSDRPTLPRPVVKKMRWPFPVIWLVPLLAACLSGYYLYKHHQETGTQITIQFDDVAGIKPGETTVTLHGVTIGHVKTVTLADDHQHVQVHVQLEQSAEFLCRTGSRFWLVKPEISPQNITGLSTLVSGPYIDSKPGDGDATNSFIGLNAAPMDASPGVRITLLADQIGELKPDSPVSYRGIQVGVVKDIRLASDAESVNVTALIWEPFHNLVRSNSQFWLVKAADLQGSLLGGVKLKLGTVQNLLSGGVGFATPEKNVGGIVGDGATFFVHDQSNDEWLKWKPKIPLPPDRPDDSKKPTGNDAVKKELPTIDKHT